jgi:hypothetical protein
MNKDSWELIGKYESMGVDAEAYRSNQPQIDDDFALGIFFGTFESRGLLSSMLLHDKACRHSIIIFFNESKDTPLRKQFDPMLIEQVTKCSMNKPYLVDNVSIKEVDSTLNKIILSIPSESWTIDTKWFIDISGSPTPYFLGLLAHVKDIFPNPKLVIFNPTGDYGTTNTDEFSFTSGYDSINWVPYLWGKPNPNLPRTFIFLLGFEGERSFEVFYRCEPDKVKAIIANPGYKDEYTQIPLKRNVIFLEESGLIDKQNNKIKNIVEASASNPLDVWKKLEKIVQKEKGKSNIIFVPLGPKAHALGSGFCAMSDSTSSILYHMPNAYSIRDVKRGQFCWKYNIVF